MMYTIIEQTIIWQTHVMCFVLTVNRFPGSGASLIFFHGGLHFIDKKCEDIRVNGILKLYITHFDAFHDINRYE